MIHPNDPLAAGLFEKGPNIQVLSTTLVDGEPWYTISCLREASVWIRDRYRDQENKLWFENIDDNWRINFNVFDVNEQFYAIIMLKWS